MISLSHHHPLFLVFLSALHSSPRAVPVWPPPLPSSPLLSPRPTLLPNAANRSILVSLSEQEAADREEGSELSTAYSITLLPLIPEPNGSRIIMLPLSGANSCWNFPSSDVHTYHHLLSSYESVNETLHSFHLFLCTFFACTCMIIFSD